VGLWCILEGYANRPAKEWLAYPDDRKEALFNWGKEPVIIQRNKIPAYINDPVFRDALDIWRWYQDKGLMPHSQNWYDNPAHVIDVIELFNETIAEHRSLHGNNG
jgi:hypothetical protein